MRREGSCWLPAPPFRIAERTPSNLIFYFIFSISVRITYGKYVFLFDNIFLQKIKLNRYNFIKTIILNLNFGDLLHINELLNISLYHYFWHGAIAEPSSMTNQI